MQLKDYYKILGISPSAPMQEIKQAYRKLAFQYHPDKNPENHFAEAHFKEVQEAYATLSHTHKRQKYDEERWLSGMGNRMHDKQAITPEWLLKECIKLNVYIDSIDTFRMSQRSLYEYLMLIISDSHIGVLKQFDHTATTHLIIAELLKTATRMEHQYFETIGVHLATLAGTDNTVLLSIHNALEEKRKKERSDKLMPVIVVTITLIICLLMYLYGRK